jgi:hypothetical protein
LNNVAIPSSRPPLPLSSVDTAPGGGSRRDQGASGVDDSGGAWDDNNPPNNAVGFDMEGSSKPSCAVTPFTLHEISPAAQCESD